MPNGAGSDEAGTPRVVPIKADMAEFEAVAQDIVRGLMQGRTILAPLPEHREARLSIGFQTAVVLLGWFAGLRRALGPEDLQAGRRLFDFVQERSPAEQRKSLHRALVLIARGWRPVCWCGCGRMETMTDAGGKEVPGAFVCPRCGAWAGKEVRPEEDRRINYLGIWGFDKSRVYRRKHHRYMSEEEREALRKK